MSTFYCMLNAEAVHCWEVILQWAGLWNVKFSLFSLSLSLFILFLLSTNFVCYIRIRTTLIVFVTLGFCCSVLVICQLLQVMARMTPLMKPLSSWKLYRVATSHSLTFPDTSSYIYVAVQTAHNKQKHRSWINSTVLVNILERTTHSVTLVIFWVSANIKQAVLTLFCGHSGLVHRYQQTVAWHC